MKMKKLNTQQSIKAQGIFAIVGVFLLGSTILNTKTIVVGICLLGIIVTSWFATDHSKK